MKAYSELLAFFHFHNTGCLHSLGWPATGYGQTPPFDLQLRIDSVVLPADVKPASGSGVDLLREELQKIAKAWQKTHNLPHNPLSIRYVGTVTQQQIGPAIRTGALGAFQQALDALTTPPDVPVAVKHGDLHIEVTFESNDDGIDMTAGSQPVQGIVDSLAPTLQKHVSGKAASSAKHGSPPFLLVYVLTPEKGNADMRSQQAMLELVSKVSQSPQLTTLEGNLWLGVMFLDFARGTISEPVARLVARRQATWPQGLAATQISQIAKAHLIDI